MTTHTTDEASRRALGLAGMAGPAVMLLGMLLFAMNDAMGKWLVASYGLGQVILIRSIAALLILAPFLWMAGLKPIVEAERPWLQFTRVVFSTLELFCFYYAVMYLPLADVMTYWLAAPIYVAAAAPFLLGEKVGWRRWTAILFGLVGVVIMLAPSGDGFNSYIWLPLICAVLGAIYGIATRLVSRDDQPSTSFFYLAIVGFIGSNLLGPFFWTPFTPVGWGLMLALCCTGIIGHLSLIKAYENLDAVIVQPISYWQLVLGAMIAVTVFGEVLRWNTVVGAVIVVAAGLFTVWREWVVSRRAKRAEEEARV